MTLVLSILFLVFKVLVIFIDLIIFQHFKFHVIFTTSVLIYVLYLRKLNKARTVYYFNIKTPEQVTDHIMQYRFKSREDRNATFIFLIISFSILIIGIFSLRIKNLSHIIDVNKIVLKFINDFYLKVHIVWFIYNILLLCICIYAFFLTMSIIRRFYIKHVMRCHFYLSKENSKYYKVLNHLTFTNLLYRFISFLSSVEDDIIHFICFFRFKHIFKKNNYIKISQNIDTWTKEERIYYNKFCKKYQKYFTYSRKLIETSVYNFHYIIATFIMIYDMIFNKMILTHFVYYLPIMFILNIYVIYCRFVFEKAPYGIISYTNHLYYSDVRYLHNGRKGMIMINGYGYEIDYEYPDNFLKFELNNFNIRES